MQGQNLLSELITSLTNVQTDIEEYLDFHKNSTLFDVDNLNDLDALIDKTDINKCIREELTSLDYSCRIESQINKLDYYFNNIKILYNIYIAQKNNYLSLKMDPSMVESSGNSIENSGPEDVNIESTKDELEEVSKMFIKNIQELNENVYGSDVMKKG